MSDIPTLQGWLEKLELESALEGPKTLLVRSRAQDPKAPLPPFYIQCGEHWVLLAMLPMLAADEWRPDDLNLRLLAANRDMRVAKFAIDKNGDVVLCAELPTESLDFSELADAVKRMTEYARLFRVQLMQR